MDTSERYIEMCRQAKELQDRFIYEKSDKLRGYYIWVPIPLEKNKVMIISDMTIPSEYRKMEFMNHSSIKVSPETDMDTVMKTICVELKDVERKYCIWLPRQDQLQKILNLDLSSLGKELIAMSVFDDDDGSSTYEQLLIKMVMKEKFNKRWDFDKSEWVGI